MADFWGDLGEGLFGTRTRAQGQQNAQAATQGYGQAQSGAAAAGQAAGQVGAQAQGMTQQAQAQGRQYDQGASQSMGANASDYMNKAQANATDLASKQAQQASTQGTQQALKAARSSGLNAGQAALASGQQAANTYQNSLAQGTQQGIQNYMGAAVQFAGQGNEMAGRAQSGINSQLSATGQQINAAGTQAQAASGQGNLGATQNAQAAQTAQNTWGAVGNLAGSGAMLMSDENAKKNIDSILSKISDEGSPLDQILAKLNPVQFDYKDEPDGTNHVGVTAQNLEETPLKNAVKDTPQGKVIDTTELAPGLLDLIIELGSQNKQLNARLRALEGAQ